MRRGAVLVVVILVVSACAMPAGRPDPGTAPAAPFGTVDAVGRGRIEGAELAGRDLALWFWAPW